MSLAASKFNNEGSRNPRDFERFKKVGRPSGTGSKPESPARAESALRGDDGFENAGLRSLAGKPNHRFT